MTREEKQKAIDVLKISAPVSAVTQEEFNDYIKTLNKIMDWLEQAPCEDAVSRQAVLDLIADYDLSMGQVVKAIHALPPVTPQPKIVRCSQCKYAEVADSEDSQDGYTCQFHRGSIWFSGSYCSWAERRQDG